MGKKNTLFCVVCQNRLHREFFAVGRNVCNFCDGHEVRFRAIGRDVDALIAWQDRCTNMLQDVRAENAKIQESVETIKTFIEAQQSALEATIAKAITEAGSVEMLKKQVENLNAVVRTIYAQSPATHDLENIIKQQADTIEGLTKDLSQRETTIKQQEYLLGLPKSDVAELQTFGEGVKQLLSSAQSFTSPSPSPALPGNQPHLTWLPTRKRTNSQL
ncbi:uncharacterized protein UTRI_03532_B [Ustilago trichophora]|uniref:Uncharacterized protein n=1 Tax=Ustilago trichophora TaxID=86804 RepID=A0A5C3DZQ5_9BASI|nr:uncharacterized protein UTRI_03532_B [Ustilago trichophora]